MRNHGCGIAGAVVMAMVLAAGAVWGATPTVTSKAVSKPIQAGQDVSFVLDVDSPTSVSALNGEVRYDAALLSDPRVAAGSGASGYTVTGNEAAPGRFRFIAYKTATATMDLSKPALVFTVKVTPDLRASQLTTKLQYYVSGASKINGISYGSDVGFLGVTLNFATGVQVWTSY